MPEPMTRRGFVARAALLAAAVPAAVSPPGSASGAAQPPITLQYFRGADMQHGETLATDTDPAALRAIAERHAGAPLEWGMGETEECIAYAMHPTDVAEYLLVEAGAQ